MLIDIPEGTVIFKEGFEGFKIEIKVGYKPSEFLVFRLKTPKNTSPVANLVAFCSDYDSARRKAHEWLIQLPTLTKQ